MFAILGMRAALGRLFDRSTPDVAVISDRLWHARFHGMPSAVGATISIGRTPLRIIGVLSPHAGFIDRGIDVFFPLTVDGAIGTTRRTPASAP
ncbi:MAG: ABC transporter permease [Candidatus Eremiobacteraeota bacterium]|nr:ABC transporter permease [Candidatus Eremiobacteraeota bacterium]